MNKKMLFIGGWTRDKKSYQKLFDSIPEEYEVIFLPCYDILDISSMDESADQVKTFMVINKIDKALIAGHSLGGTVAIEFALKYPEMVEELVLIDSGGLKVSQSFFEKTKNATRDQILNFSRKTKANVSFGFRFARRPVKNIQSLLTAYSHDLSDRLSQLKSKTLIIWGGEDHVYPPEQGQIFKESIRDSSLKIIPKMDHDWVIHSPQYFWQEVGANNV